MIEALKVARELLTLTPAVRDAVRALVSAFRTGDDLAARKAYEAGRRAAFAARQR